MNKTEEATLVGVFDENETRGKITARKFDTKYFNDLDELLSLPNLEIGVVTVENALKKDYAVSLARAGIHVLSDKPLGITAKESHEVVSECKKARVSLQVAYVSRYLRQAQLTKISLDQGEVDKIRFINCENRVDMGLVKTLSPWLLKKGAAGGGALMEHSVHVIDLALWFNEGTTAESVYATRANNLDKSCQGEDNFVIAIRFKDGSLVSVDGSYCRPSSGSPADIVMTIIGQKGVMRMFSSNLELREYSHREPNTTIKSFSRITGTSDSQNSAELMARDMIRSIRTGEEPLTNGRAAERVNRIVDAAYKSLNSGKKERI